MALFPLFAEKQEQREGSGDISYRYGAINFIIVTSGLDLHLWAHGTNLLIAMKPVTKEQAIKFFNKLFTEAGRPHPGPQ